ncbi:MAG: hypothetical protein DWG79_01980 [Chloroflexi bacterium]|nr:hypothetical protein [Chloroflexota bacterium]
MDWMMVIVLCGAVAYSARIVVEYMEIERETLPEIDRWNRKTERLVDEIETEVSLRNQSKDHISTLHESVHTLQERVNGLRAEVDNQQKLTRRLQLESDRQEIRKRRRVSA